ncbi:type I-B CRISPR-associated endonuclease Cas1b [Fulvivirga maritima]|uniref:type I-B CRISPR-associated endonuclease Cas1b n=1 Tax=Fulvivirga maritima TaxID=2904247 RepID=UPI001F20C131|nr:type I-B CRISPR-associated endonuclease Cas1b [Fulvivirga maritima]UII25137.1 type I-B CRISPR-associated endonuclease Cas1b [Fulvivirga maritima]
MKKTYYLFNPGRLSRKDNTLKFTPVDDDGKELMPKYIPVENVSDLYLYGSLDANSALYNFLGKSRINVHFFDYYEHYTGSFYAKEYLQAGKLQVEQTRHYLSDKNRLEIARPLIKGAAHNMLRNLKYYKNRGKNTTPAIDTIEQWISDIDQSQAIDQLMGIEGNIRQCYYIGIDEILKDLKMEGRSKQPPKNEVNSLISFGNMICYTICLDQIYHTQLNPTISFLHEPGARRFSLALDIAEIFKPLLVDRVIFSLLNKQQLKADDFHDGTGRITLKEKGKKVFLKAWEDRLNQTIKHRSLGRHVSYKHLIKLECYKLCNHLIGAKEYQPFKAWW